MESIAPPPTNVRRATAVFALFAAAGALILIVSLVPGLPRLAASRGDAYGAAMFTVSLLGVSLVELWRRNARLLVGGKAIGYQDILGRRRTWAASDVGSIVDASVVFRGTAPPRRYVFFLGPDGRRLMMITPTAWGATAVDRLVRAAGKPPYVLDRPTSPEELRRRFPGTLGRAYTRPWIVVGLAAMVIIVLAISLAITLR